MREVFHDVIGMRRYVSILAYIFIAVLTFFLISSSYNFTTWKKQLPSAEVAVKGFQSDEIKEKKTVIYNKGYESMLSIKDNHTNIDKIWYENIKYSEGRFVDNTQEGYQDVLDILSQSSNLVKTELYLTFPNDLDNQPVTNQLCDDIKAHQEMFDYDGIVFNYNNTIENNNQIYSGIINCLDTNVNKITFLVNYLDYDNFIVNFDGLYGEVHINLPQEQVNQSGVDSFIQFLASNKKEFNIMIPSYVYFSSIWYNGESNYSSLRDDMISKEIMTDSVFEFYTTSRGENGYLIKNYIYDEVFQYNFEEYLKQSGVKKYVKGFTLPFIGFESPGIWGDISHESIENSYVSSNQVKLIGKGSYLKVNKGLTKGKREAKLFNGYITSYKITEPDILPELERYTGPTGNKNLLLTFDDGPHPLYTEQILDILKEKDVKATFFILGKQVPENTEILKRIYKEGHTIGNHSYRHLNLNQISMEDQISEVEEAQEVIQDIIGIDPLYYRPPFGVTLNIATINDMEKFSYILNKDFIISEFTADSKDYRVESAEKLIEDMKNIEYNDGDNILFHDIKKNTVDALPEIIDFLESEGYNLVNSDDHLQITSYLDNPDPKVNINPRLVEFSSFGNTAIKYFTILYFIFSLIRFILYFILYAVGRKKESNTNYFTYEDTVTAVIPFYNEERNILQTIQSVLDSDYPYLNIIAVDDGSTDKSLELVNKEYKNNKKVTIITQKNSGKFKAQNSGILSSNSKYILSVDGDSIIKNNAVRELVNSIIYYNYGAVAGRIISLKMNFFSILQEIEYDISQSFYKVIQDKIGCVSVLPGAISLWRIDALRDTKGFKGDTLAEDMEKTINLAYNHWRVGYCDRAIALTESPRNLNSLFKQRIRWNYGTMQVFYKYKSMLFNKKYKSYGYFLFIDMLLNYLFIPVLVIVATYLLIVLAGFIIFQLYNQNDLFEFVFQSNYFELLAVGLIINLLILAMILITSLANPDSRKRIVKLLMIPAYLLFYAPFLQYCNFISLIKAFDGRKARWNHKSSNYANKVSKRSFLSNLF